MTQMFSLFHQNQFLFRHRVSFTLYFVISVSVTMDFSVLIKIREWKCKVMSVRIHCCVTALSDHFF